MSKIIEDYKRRQKEKQKEEEKTSSSAKNSSSSGESRIISEYKARKSINFDTLESDLTSVNSLLNDIGSNWQTKETMANSRSAVESMYNRLVGLRDYNKQYGNTDVVAGVTGLKTSFDEISRTPQVPTLEKSPMVSFRDRILNKNNVSNYLENQMTSPLDSLIGAYDKALKGWDKRTELYGGFKNADAFNVAKKNPELSQKFSGLSYDDVQEEKKKYKVGSDEYNFLNTYTGYTDSNDFNKAIEEESKYRDPLTKAMEYERKIKGYENSKNQFETRSHGISDGGYGKKIKETKAEYEKYLSSLGYANIDEMRADFDKRTYDGSLYYDSLSQAKNKHELEYGTFDLHKEDMQNPDFKEKSQYKSTGFNDFFGYGDEVYEYINDVDDARNIITAMHKEGNGSILYEDKGYNKLYPEEVALYNYYYELDKEHGTNKAKEFLDEMEIALSKRVYNEITAIWEEWADEGFWSGLGMSVASVPMSLAGGVGNLIESGKELITGKEYNPYSPGRMASNFSSDTREYVGENIAEATEGFELFGKNVPSFLYQTGMSRLDSLVGGVTMGPAYTVLMGANAYQQKAKELTEKGFDNSTVQANALISGALEVVFEKIGFDHLMKMKDADSLAKVFVNGLKQAGAEGLEELGTELGNIIADEAILGENSEFARMYRDLVSRGYTEKEANSKLAMEITTRLGFATAGGFLAGYGVGGGYGIKGYNVNKSTGSTIRTGENGVADTFNLASMTPEESSAYKAYTEYANKGVTAENITDAQLGNLYSKTRESYNQTLSEKQKALSEEQKKLDEIDEKLLDKPLSALESYDAEKKALYKERKTANQSVSKASEAVGTAFGNMLSLESVYQSGAEAQQIAKEQAKKEAEEQKKIETRVAELNVGKVTNVTETGKSVQIEGIKVEDSKTSIITSEGEVSVEDMTFSDRDSKLIATAEEIATTEGNEVASLFISQDDGQTDINAYRNAFDLASSYAKGKFTENYILQHKGVLSTEQVKAIYNKMVTEPRLAQQKAIDDINKKMGNTMSYKGFIEDSIIDYTNSGVKGKVKWSDLDTRQRKAITFIKGIAQATGMNLVLIDDGLKKGINGAFEIKNNTITIDIYAGINKVADKLADTIIPTMSHEMTHWLKEKSPELYRKLDEYIFETLMLGGKTEGQILNERRSKMSNGKTATDEQVRDEVIARACEDMLSMSEEGKRLFNSLSEDEKKTLVGKIREIIENIKDWINKLLSSYKSDSDEAKALREYQDRLNEISKMWDEMLVDAVKSNQSLEMANVFGHLTNGISKDGTTIIGENTAQMSNRTYREGGRDFLINWLDGHRGLTEADKQDIIDQTDRIAELMRAIENDEHLPDYSNWANMEVVKDENGEKILSVIVKNGDYAMNIDFSQVCKKRVALNAVLNAMVQSGDLNVHTLTETDVADLNAIIKEHDFEIACALCFVDSKRYRVGAWAESFCEGSTDKKGHKYGFNEMVRSLIPKGSDINVDEFNFTGRDIKNQPTKNLLSDASDSDLDFSLIDEIMANNDPKSAQHRYAKAIKENPEIRKILNHSEIISSIGLDAIRLESPKLYGLINGHQGTAKPKFSHDVVAYGNDILKAKNFTAESAKMVGGVRCQSFSDFMANMVVDYAQFISELSAKQLTSHSYTKEPLFVKLFGLTGMKINMSLVPKAIDMTPEQQEYFAVLKDKNVSKNSKIYKTRLAEYEALAENAGLDENGNYIWEDETFPYDIAMDIVVDPRYSANCGTIAVGISSKHILKLLADERISMVIPYHKSGLNHEVAMMRDIALYHDYTNVQNTRFGDGSKLDGVPDFSFYADLYGVDGKEGTHDPKKTAQNYLAWCDENGYIPKFDEFRIDPNYYKLLVDFRVYDTDGTYREQQPVKAIYPEDAEFRDLILNGVKDKNGKVYGGLKQQQQTSDKLSRESQEIIDEYREMLKEKYGKDVLVQYDDRDIPSYTDQEYRDYGWARENELLNAGQNADYRSKFAMAKNGRLKFNKSKKGEYIIPVSDINDPNFEGVNNVLVFAMGTIDNPIITSIIEIYEYDETNIEKIRREIYDFERRGIQPKVRNTFRRYNAYDFRIRPNKQGSAFGGIRHSGRNELQNRERDSGATVTFMEKTNEKIKQNQDRDSEGRELSEGQKEYFKDSIVRDEDGNLRVMYHGTPTGGFTEFKLPHYLHSLTSAQGAGYYFTDKANAKQYTKAFNGKSVTKKQLYQVYLNITNPLEISEYSEGAISDDVFRRIMARGNYKWGMEHTDVEKRLRVSHYDSDRLAEMVKVFNGEEILNVMKEELGYDGVHFTDRWGDIWVAWDKSQIKNVDNTNPTSHPDIRYSDREDTPSVYDLMGENERLRKTTEILKADIEHLKERLKLEKKVTGGNTFKESSLDTVANHLIKISNSTIDKKVLIPLLKDVYSFVANSTESDMADENYWAELQAKCYDVASQMVAESKPQMVMDDYPKMILRDIRSTPIWLSEGQKAELKHRYGDKWYNNLFGKIKTSQDSAHDLESKWREWSAQYPDIFSSDVNEAEMGFALIEAYDTLREASETIVEYDTEEMTHWLSNEIYNQYWNVSRFTSTADKYNKRIKELQSSHKKAMTELRESYKVRVDRQKLADEMYYGRKTNELKKEYETKLREQHKADKEKAMELVKRIRERKEFEVSEAKRVGRERMSNYRTELERKKRIQSITANTLALKRKLLKNSPDEHIPEVMKPVVIAFVNALDFSSKRMLEKGIPTQKDISLYKALEKVKDMMSEANANKEAYAELAGIISDENVKKLVESAWDIKEKLGDNEFILNNMPVDRLESLDHVVRAIKYIVNQTNKFYVANHAKGITNLAQETMTDMNSLGKAKLYDGLRANISKMLNWGNAIPYYAFNRFGEGGRKIFEAFQDGWDTFAFNIKQIVDYANETYKADEVKEWDEDIKTFKILIPATEADLSNPDYKSQHQEVQMTVSQIMSLYCLQKREQAKGHMLGGGIRVADFKTKKGAIVSQSDGAVLTQKDIDTIVGTLTDRQKAVADKLQEFMNTVCSDWGNYVSMTRFGYKAFGEENYFPIQSDDNNLAVNDATEQNNSLFRLLNMSFAKSLTENANNRIVISNIFDVFAQHTSDMAKYNALALPVLDAFRWYNYTEKTEKGDGTFVTSGVKQSIESAFGKDGQNYITTFLRDINGAKEVSRDTLGKGFYTRAKIAAVGANLRVVLLQPTSYVRANAVINPKYLTEAFLHKPKIAHAEKHCGIALWKSMGYYDTNVQKGVEDLIKHNETWKDKAVELSMKGAEVADKITWGYLWNACELEIRDTRKDLKVGSEEFFEAVGKRLREVIYATQVVDSTMTRSQMMRSSDGWDKMLTSFASEPTLAYNMLQDAYMSYSLDKRRMGKKEAVRKNAKHIARVVSTYTITHICAALVESGFDALRDDDDDDEKDIAYFMSLYLENFASDMSITGKIPYIKEMHSILKGFGSSRTDTQWMESFVKAGKAWQKVVGGEGSPTKAIRDSIKVISYVSGLPFYNALRDMFAVLDKAEILTAEDLEEMFEDFFE